MRLIDADALKEELKEPNVWWETESQAQGIIDAAPTIDPVKHGKWEVKPTLRDNVWLCRCSACRHKFSLNGSNNTIELAYCPWCGAKMDGGEDEQMD